MSSNGGRPRDPAIDRAVIGAVLEVLHSQGYARFTLEAVAVMAGTTKPAIRRRWPSRQRLIIDALASTVATPPVPDNGCTRCDLMQSVRLLNAALHDRLPRRVLPPLIADCAEHPELHHYLLENLIEPSRHAALSAVQHAVARGDLRPDVDALALVDLLASAVYQQSLLGQAALSEAQLEQIVDLLLRGAAVDFARLLEISQQPAHRRHQHATTG